MDTSVGAAPIALPRKLTSAASGWDTTCTAILSCTSFVQAMPETAANARAGRARRRRGIITRPIMSETDRDRDRGLDGPAFGVAGRLELELLDGLDGRAVALRADLGDDVRLLDVPVLADRDDEPDGLPAMPGRDVRRQLQRSRLDGLGGNPRGPGRHQIGRSRGRHLCRSGPPGCGRALAGRRRRLGCGNGRRLLGRSGSGYG